MPQAENIISPSQFVYSVLQRFEAASCDFINGYGKSVYIVPLGDKDLALEVCKFLNKVLRYQLSSEAMAAIEKEKTECAEKNKIARPRDSVPMDLMSSKFSPCFPEAGIRLSSNIPVKLLIEYIHEAMLHPERGQDLRAEDGWRSIHFRGWDQTLASANSLFAENLREINDPTEREVQRIKMIQAKDALLGDMAHQMPGIGIEELSAIYMKLPTLPNLNDWKPGEREINAASKLDRALKLPFQLAA